jgi:hypothetical protein
MRCKICQKLTLFKYLTTNLTLKFNFWFRHKLHSCLMNLCLVFKRLSISPQLNNKIDLEDLFFTSHNRRWCKKRPSFSFETFIHGERASNEGRREQGQERMMMPHGRLLSYDRQDVVVVVVTKSVSPCCDTGLPRCYVQILSRKYQNRG